MQENWKPIKNYEGIYEISDLGRVKRVGITANGTKLRILKGSNTNGYRGIFLYKNGTPKHHYIHDLVLKGFVSEKGLGLVCNHKDGNKLNNCLDNLEYCTYSENNSHAYRHDLKKSSQQKLSDSDIPEILKLKKSNSYSVIAKKYNVHVGTITQIFAGRTWKKAFKEAKEKEANGV